MIGGFSKDRSTEGAGWNWLHAKDFQLSGPLKESRRKSVTEKNGEGRGERKALNVRGVKCPS